MSQKVVAVVIDRLVQLVEQSASSARMTVGVVGIPRTLAGLELRGINRAIATWTSLLRGQASNTWLTAHQALQRGWRIKKSAWNAWTPLLMWRHVSWTAKRNGGASAVRTRMIPSHFIKIFNVEHCEGTGLPTGEEQSTISASEMASRVTAGMPRPPAIVHGAAKPYYLPSTDTVYLPDRDTFANEAEYFSALFHEIAHATGHPSRLARKSLIGPCRFGGTLYAQDEAVAETVAMFLSTACGFAGVGWGSADYLASWLPVIRDQPMKLLEACQLAQRAYDYVLGLTFDKNANSSPESDSESRDLPESQPAPSATGGET